MSADLFRRNQGISDGDRAVAALAPLSSKLVDTVCL